VTCDYALSSSRGLAPDDDTMCPECARPGLGTAHGRERQLRRSFRAEVNLRVSRSGAAHVARGWPLVTVAFRPFWHGSGAAEPADLSDRDTNACGMG